MFDLGWMELVIIGVTALIVVGPKDLPVMFKTVGNFVGKAKRMAREFKSTMEAAAEDSGLSETSDMLKNLDRLKGPADFFKTEANDVLYGKSNGDQLNQSDQPDKPDKPDQFEQIQPSTKKVRRSQKK
jgi:sec-independent protein translocase protein TatB